MDLVAYYRHAGGRVGYANVSCRAGKGYCTHPGR